VINILSFDPRVSFFFCDPLAPFEAWECGITFLWLIASFLACPVAFGNRTGTFPFSTKNAWEGFLVISAIWFLARLPSSVDHKECNPPLL